MKRLLGFCTYRARALVGLVRNRCLRSPPGYMQGGSRCLGRAIERQRARWHDPVLGRWLGLTPEQPALCLRGSSQGGPGQPRVGSVTLPGWVGVRYAQGAARGAVRAKNDTICPTQACNI
eukprot:scaffold75905_cov20-Phaeocystis_antarctica.AAC.1